MAQAKVNLFLHVLEREPSGYHQIETLFCRLDLADDVVVRIPVTPKETARTLDCVGDDTGVREENLAYRAAVLYAEKRGWPSGFAIEITKRIPVGGGLGGAARTRVPCSACFARSTRNRRRHWRFFSGPRSLAPTSRS